MASTADLHVQRVQAPSCAYRGCNILVRLPWRIATFNHLLEDLSVPEGVHGAPKSFVAVRHKLATLDEALEGLHHQLVPFLNVVEYLLAENEIPAIDPYVGLMARAHSAHDALLVEVSQMKGDWRGDGYEKRDFSAFFEGINHLPQRGVG